MESFYENIFSGQSVGEAMWRTKKEYFKKIQQRSFTDAMMYVAPFIAVTQAVMKPSEQAVIVRRTSPITSVPDRRQEIQMTSAGGSAGYVRDVNGILVWNNKPMANESALWEGQSEDGFASGLGKLTWRKDGLFDVYYEGRMVMGKLHGTTNSLDARGNKRVRTWQNGKKLR